MSDCDLHKSEIIEMIEPAASNNPNEHWDQISSARRATVRWKPTHRRWIGTTSLTIISRYWTKMASIKTFSPVGGRL